MRRLRVVVLLVGLSAVAQTSRAPSSSNWPNAFSVFQRVQPLAPAPQAPTSYPLGNDLWLASQGSADVRLQNWSYTVTATTSVSGQDGGASIPVLVGSASICPSTNTTGCYYRADAGFLGGSSPWTTDTSKFCTPAAGCGIFIEDFTSPSFEFLGPSNWSITSGTTITGKFRLPHTQPFHIYQLGATNFDTRLISINQGGPTDSPINFLDMNGNFTFTIPNDTSGTFPLSAFQFGGLITGSNSTLADGGGGDLIYRQRSAASAFKMVSSPNTSTLLQLSEFAWPPQGVQAEPSLDFGGNFTDGGVFSTLRITADPDIPRIIGGGWIPGSTGLLVYTSRQSDAGGVFEVRDNQTSDTPYFAVDSQNGLTSTYSRMISRVVGSTNYHPQGSAQLDGWEIIGIGYDMWTANSTTQTIKVFELPTWSRVITIIAETTPYAGLAGTIQLKVGTSSGGNELLLSHDVKTAYVAKGFASGDLGTCLATPVQGGCWGPSDGTNMAIYVTLTSGTGNIGNGTITNMNAGATNLYVKTESIF